MTRFFSKFSAQTDLPGVLQPGSVAHILWLRQRCPLGEAALQLKKEIVKQGLSLEVKDVFDWASRQFTSADLILLDAFDRVDGTAETVVTHIRMESRVPLVMLTDGYSTEQLVTALSAGADAVWALNTPLEVLIARCKAMLRRQSFTLSTYPNRSFL